MQNPSPVNLKTPAEVRADGWQAESRDDDGHLCTSHAPFVSAREMHDYIAEEIGRGKTVTIWPMKEKT
jgi:sulfur-carrier protein